MKIEEIQEIVFADDKTGQLASTLESMADGVVHLKGLVGSAMALKVSTLYEKVGGNHLVVLPDKESSAYFLNDLECLYNEKGDNFHKKKILFFPASYKRSAEIESQDNTSILLRTEVLKRFGTSKRKSIVITYPEALAELVVRKAYLSKNTIKLKRGEPSSLDDIADLLIENEFDRVDFVYEPGQFAIRGGIIDVFSYTNDFPYRIEFFGEEVESIRSFNPTDQLSIDKLDRITIVPNLQDRRIVEKRESLLSFITSDTLLWFEDFKFTVDKIEQEYDKIKTRFDLADESDEVRNYHPTEFYLQGNELHRLVDGFRVIEFGKQFFLSPSLVEEYRTSPQPSFNKNFDLLIADLTENTRKGYKNLIFSENPNQIKRLYAIFDDIHATKEAERQFEFDTAVMALHSGFIDHDHRIACYTDHQIFERYHKFHLKEKFAGSQALTLKEIHNLQPGDFVTHIDHGIGRFDGLEKVDNNGKMQEAIRLNYRDGDLLYISIHSLHRISKYAGKEGAVPSLNRLGTNAWNKLKSKTKNKVKDIAKELIKLYAERKSAEGFKFSPDTYLQHELEASFIYEDTPDQVKSTQDVKHDMELGHPMDRLICGDVGFGKTEVAIRAAFKAVADSKQVAVLVPTTILALQHFKTFSDRLKEFPCRVEYINRFKSAKDQTQIKKDLKDKKIDILIGTHRLISKDIEFENIGLLIIDEEQKFGVSTKEKLKRFKVNVDTLTLTATPIPRTLQFSLMGARDLSIINTPPPNRYPVLTELKSFNGEMIRDAINYEVDRGGQVFFVHNRVQNIEEVADMIRKLCPELTIAIGHGQMDGHKLEKIMLEFINGKYDVLLATTIIESGLDIPNVNTIIINDAQNFGLSDLHQLRGRVGRANRKAFCYLISPPMSVLTPEARKRLKAIEEFSELGSGLNIAMRDLDIRGAGNILGAEQSGFISDIGFEMYHKILDEAVTELKENEFKELYADQISQEYVKDCQIESDLAVLITDDYVVSISERLSLYKELDDIQEEEELQRFRMRMIDRFGPLPHQTEELVQTIRLRWLAKELGFEKIIMKNERFTGYFISNQESPFYQSVKFTGILRFVQLNPRLCRMKEARDKLTLTFANIDTITKAINVLREIVNRD